MNLSFQPTPEYFNAEVFAKIGNLQENAISKSKKVACIVQGISDSHSRPTYETFGGFNIEFSSSDVIHAERMALTSCISERYYPVRLFVTSTSQEKEPTLLCGDCRQLCAEINSKLEITVFNPDGTIKAEKSLNEVFPYHKDTKKKNLMFEKYCTTPTRFDIDWSKI